MQLTWLGAAGFKIETLVGAVILIDPFLSRPEDADPKLSIQPADLSPVDEILLTESRFVQAMDTVALVKNTGAIAHAPPQVCQHLMEAGVSTNNIEQVIPYKTKTVARLHWQAWAVHDVKNNTDALDSTIPAPLRKLITAWPPSQITNYTFQTEGLTMIHIGNIDWIDPELEGLQPDIALLPVDPTAVNKTIQLAAKLKPSIIVPHHWDNYYPPLTQAINVDELKKTLQTKIPACPIFWPEPGHSFNIAEML